MRPMSRMSTMRLYVDSQFASPYALSAFVALRAKHITFELEPLDLSAHGQHAASYAQASLTRRVPTLVDGDFSLSESSAIAEYLEDKQPQPRLYPADLRARARARQVQAWLRSDLMALRQDRTTEVVFYGAAVKPLSEGGRTAAEKLLQAAGALLEHGGPHLAGGEWSIADVDLALMLNRLVMAGDAVPGPLAEYARRQWQHAAIQEWVAFERPPL
jgi:glutathione S-transferase